MAFEINEQFGKEISNLFTENGFSTVQIIKDIFGKERIVTGIN
jgi:methylase of polypeptide subunit release factors